MITPFTIACLPCKLAFGWVCTIKGWVVLDALVLAAVYFALAYVLRYWVFPPLKTLFENIVVYQVMKTPLKNWITQLKWAFYGALGYIALGISGILGAILAIQLLLWIFTAYLAVSFAINVYAAVKTLQSIFAVLDDLHKACDFLPALFWGGDCDGFFSMIDKVIYGGAGVVLLFQSLTLICALLLIRRINKKTGRCCFTFCGHPRADKKHKELANSLDKEIPYGRRRRVAGSASVALLSGSAEKAELPPLSTTPAYTPRASFELARRPRGRRRALGTDPTLGETRQPAKAPSRSSSGTPEY